MHSIRHSVWAKAYYDMMRHRGLKPSAAIRSLAFKWIRILYHCWKTDTEYSEARYFQALYKRKSPLLEFMAKGPPTHETPRAS